MILTVLLSVGGTWVSNMINTSVNHTQINQLIKNDVENKTVNGIVHSLVVKVEELEKDYVSVNSELIYQDKRLDGVEVNAARATQAIENLVTATQGLTETNKQLIIAVAKLEK